ncbi:MAG: NIPSNAP family protein [Pseudomonadota bacterium]
MTVFLQSTLQCHGNGLSDFLGVMKMIKPIVEAAGWRLDRAFLHRTGRLHTVVDIWELEDFNSYDVGIAALVAHPNFIDYKAVLDRTLIREDIIFLSKTDYSP